MRKTSIGGQALIEGVMMRSPESVAMAVRKPDGEIIVDKKPVEANKNNKILKAPVIRGSVEFVKMVVVGIKAIMFSAEFVDIEEDEKGKESKFDAFLEKIFGDKLMDAIIYFSVVVAIAFSVGLFIILPNAIAYILPFDKSTTSGVILYNVFEGIIKVAIFFGYLALISFLKDAQRFWQYHGAEHKTIHCYEHEEELTVDNVRKYNAKHPRCGTSFLFIVMIISIIVFAFTGWHNLWINILLRLALVPLVAGLSYEALKYSGRHSETKIVKVLSAPGMALQYFTTKEPDDDQIEVAIEAFNNVLPKDKDAQVA